MNSVSHSINHQTRDMVEDLGGVALSLQRRAALYSHLFAWHQNDPHEQEGFYRYSAILERASHDEPRDHKDWWWIYAPLLRFLLTTANRGQKSLAVLVTLGMHVKGKDGAAYKRQWINFLPENVSDAEVTHLLWHVSPLAAFPKLFAKRVLTTTDLAELAARSGGDHVLKPIVVSRTQSQRKSEYVLDYALTSKTSRRRPDVTISARSSPDVAFLAYLAATTPSFARWWKQYSKVLESGNHPASLDVGVLNRNERWHNFLRWITDLSSKSPIAGVVNIPAWDPATTGKHARSSSIVIYVRQDGEHGIDLLTDASLGLLCSVFRSCSLVFGKLSEGDMDIQSVLWTAKPYIGWFPAHKGKCEADKSETPCLEMAHNPWECADASKFFDCVRWNVRQFLVSLFSGAEPPKPWFEKHDDFTQLCKALKRLTGTTCKMRKQKPHDRDGSSLTLFDAWILLVAVVSRKSKRVPKWANRMPGVATAAYRLFPQDQTAKQSKVAAESLIRFFEVFCVNKDTNTECVRKVKCSDGRMTLTLDWGSDNVAAFFRNLSPSRRAHDASDALTRLQLAGSLSPGKVKPELLVTAVQSGCSLIIILEGSKSSL